MAAVEVVINRSAVRALLRSQGAQDFGQALGEKVAAAAEAGSISGGTFVATTVAGANRAHTSVITADFPAMLDEANHHILAAAIDAAR